MMRMHRAIPDRVNIRVRAAARLIDDDAVIHLEACFSASSVLGTRPMPITTKSAAKDWPFAHSTTPGTLFASRAKAADRLAGTDIDSGLAAITRS